MNPATESSRLRELMRSLERKLGMIDDTAKSCCGITLAQCHTLVEIGRAGSLSLNELAATLDLDKSTTSRTVDNLVRSGYALRQADPANRRCVVIGLTAAGLELFSGIETDMGEYFLKVLAQIPANKRKQVLESMQILLDAVDEIK